MYNDPLYNDFISGGLANCLLFLVLTRHWRRTRHKAVTLLIRLSVLRSILFILSPFEKEVIDMSTMTSFYTAAVICCTLLQLHKFQILNYQTHASKQTLAFGIAFHAY